MPGNVRTVGTMLVHTDTNNKTENAESQHSKSTRQIQALDPKKDIGPHADRIASENISSLNNMESKTQEALDEIYKIHGFHQVSRGKLDFSPPWLLEQSFKKEHNSNWNDAYEEVAERNIPLDANVITSHVVYKLKSDEEGRKVLKARIVPHGNHDAEKDEIRKDLSTAQLFVIRLLLSIVTFLGFRLGMADIKGAYLQSGPVKREIYVRPPREWEGCRSTLWKLTKLPYGIVEAGRQWQKTVEAWMLGPGKLERVFGIGQLFVRRNIQGNILLLVAKVTDDFIIGGTIEEIENIIQAMKERFNVGKTISNQPFFFDGCEIRQKPDGSIIMSIMPYLERVSPITLSSTRRKEPQNTATQEELKAYTSLADTLLFLGNAVLPQAAFVTSLIQKNSDHCGCTT